MKKAFTLIEILIVVILLGILAAVVVPQFTNTADEARTATDQATLRTLNGQIELYKAKESASPTTFAQMEAAGYIQAEPVGQAGTFTITGGEVVYTAN